MDGDGARQAPTPSMNPQAQSHEALKAMTDAADPGGSATVADGWAELGAGFDEAASLFQRAMANSAGGWTGDAAEGMREQLARIAKWSEEIGARYQEAGTAISDQSAAADSAKTSMPPPVPYNPGQMIRDARESGNIFEMAALPFTLYAQKQKHDAAHDQAAEIVANRDTTFAAAAAAVPAFVPPPSLTEEARPEVAPHKVESGKPPVVLPPAPRTRSADAGPAGAGPAPTAGPMSGGPATPPSAGGASDPGQGTSAAGFAGAPGGASGPGQGTSAAGFTSAPGGPGGAGFGPGVPGPAGAPPGFVPGGGFGPFRGPGGPVAGAAAGGFGPGGPGQAAAQRSVPGARGAAGLAGMPMGGGEDGERKRPEYLVESEIEGMFGSDEMTSPPVIGEG